MEPANTIIRRFGTNAAVATIVGVHPTRVSNWKRPKDVGGTGGTIPFRHVPLLLKVARERGIELSVEDFLPPPARTEPGQAA